MNEDIYVDPLKLLWDPLTQEYLDFKRKVKRLAPGSIKSAGDTLANFRRICGPLASTQINQKAVNSFVEQRLDEGTAAGTVNKDLRHLRSFVRWAIKQRYMGDGAKAIDWSDVRQREAKRPVRALSVEELKSVLQTARDLYGPSWYVRVILAVASGLRQQDIERLTIADVHLDTCSLTTRSRKTGKASADRPIHPLAARALADYIATLPHGQERLFSDTYHHSKWDRIQEHAKISVKYHDLRRTFATFILEAGFSTSVAQDLLEHATPNLTHDIYANLSRVYRTALPRSKGRSPPTEGNVMRASADRSCKPHAKQEPATLDIGQTLNEPAYFLGYPPPHERYSFTPREARLPDSLQAVASFGNLYELQEGESS